MLRKTLHARSRRAAGLAAAFIAGFAATGVSADTLAQPKDDSLERAAADYVRFREDVAAVEAMPFDNAKVTREAHRLLAAHQPDGITAGWVAYAALVASDTPEFAESLKKEMKRKRNKRKGELGGRDGLISRLAQDPTYARSLPGAKSAMDAVLAMTAQDGARIVALGEAFKEQAYAMQRTAWGKKRISPPSERLTDAQSFARARGGATAPTFVHQADDGVIAPSLASAKGEWSADWGATAPAGRMTEANAEVIMDRILNLAARYSTNTLNGKMVSVYAKNNKTERCLEMSRLTLDQCIAATRTPYEEAFCLGEHALIDIATCTGWVGGAGAS
ncbi:MAG: hypothetical protein AAFW81_00920 [Pseudomonadota bacterium]